MFREYLRKEGLFLTGVEDIFFESYLQSQNGLQAKIDEIVEKVNVELKGEQENLWHCIFDVTLKKIFEHSIGQYLQLNQFTADPRLNNILAEFYKDPFFLKLDVAQKVLYNLQRLGEYEEYDISMPKGIMLWEKNFKQFSCFGRKKEIERVWLDELLRLQKKRKKKESFMRIFFPEIAGNGKVSVEKTFKEVNALYLSNEKFIDYLCHNKYESSWYSALVQAIKNFSATEELNYIWEKLTNFNTINLISQFLEQVLSIKKITYSDISRYLKSNIGIMQELFENIQQMPNILTKLLVLKQSFNYILDNSYLKEGSFCPNLLLNGLNDFLKLNNWKYREIQDIILEISVLVRWKLDDRKNEELRKGWISELKKEYPKELFERLFASLNLEDSIDFCQSERNEGNENQIDQWDEKCKCLAWSVRAGLDDLFSYQVKERLLKIIDEYIYEDCIEELGKFIICKKGVSKETIYEIVEKREDQLSGLDYDKVFGNDIEKKKIEKAVKKWLLSEKVGVICESINFSYNCKEIFKILLYHLYKEKSNL